MHQSLLFWEYCYKEKCFLCCPLTEITQEVSLSCYSSKIEHFRVIERSSFFCAPSCGLSFLYFTLDSVPIIIKKTTYKLMPNENIWSESFFREKTDRTCYEPTEPKQLIFQKLILLFHLLFASSCTNICCKFYLLITKKVEGFCFIWFPLYISYNALDRVTFS